MHPVDDRSPFVFILGMHRSGTSCLAGSLERSGLHLGRVRRTGRFNPKGYYELRSVQELHDRILAANGGSWDDPPEVIEVSQPHREQLLAIAERLSASRPCGVKDPRLLLLLPAWRMLVQEPHALVGTFRHPTAVARSLVARGSMAYDRAIRLWVHYNGLLAALHEAEPFPVVEFALSDTAAYCRRVETIASGLGLRPHHGQLMRFADSALDHRTMTDDELPERCASIYRYLQDNCVRTDDGATVSSASRAGAAVREATFSARALRWRLGELGRRLAPAIMDRSARR